MNSNKDGLKKIARTKKTFSEFVLIFQIYLQLLTQIKISNELNLLFDFDFEHQYSV